MVKHKVLDQKITEHYSLYNGDCVEVAKGLPDKSIDFTIFSPPFSNLYIYSDSESDMGNSLDDAEFFRHFEYLAPEIYRATVPGRLVAIHCKDLPLYFGRDEATGLKDFPGECIRLFEKHGFTFHSRVTIWKCPVTERERTNNNGLLHGTILRDGSQSRQGMADYMIIMRKVCGQLMSEKPVAREFGLTEYHGDKALDPRKETQHPSKFARKALASSDSINIWRRYAEPVWWDIDQKNVLNIEQARESKDEKHICPLQLDVIARSIQLWSNPGDTVFSPFAGIGSEGHQAIMLGRKFIGIELKPSYFKIACNHLDLASASYSQVGLFGGGE